MVLTFCTGLLFLASDTTLAMSPILHREEFRNFISPMKIVKTLPRLDKHIRVLWNYVKK